MRVKVSVDAEGVSTTLVVSCGDGRQTIKWLASVIHSRIKQYNIFQNSKTSIDENNFIITGISNSQNELINPLDSIFEHADKDNNLSVIASVSSSYPVDNWENPVLNDWMKISYLHSDTNKHYLNELELWRDALMNNISNPTKSPRSPRFEKKEESTLVQIGYNFSENDVNTAFELDWSNMKWNSDNIIMTNSFIRSSLGDYLKSNYSLICNIFAHYCGTGEVGQRYGLTIQEFGHFIHFLRIINFKTDEDEIEKLFFLHGQHLKKKEESKGRKEYPLMTRSHFTQTIIDIAMMNEDQKLSPTDELKSFLNSKLVPFWEKITSSYLYYTIKDPALKLITEEYYQIVKQAFLTKATKDSLFGPKLTFQNFVDLLMESSMVENGLETYCYTIFYGTQFDPSKQYELDGLVFCEFLEALSRISLRSIEGSSGLSDAKRIRMGFNFMTELQINNSANHK
eukprot:gene5050-7047_t